MSADYQAVTWRKIDKGRSIRTHQCLCTSMPLWWYQITVIFKCCNLANWIFKQVKKFTLKNGSFTQGLISLFCSFSSLSVCCMCLMLYPLFSQPHGKSATLCWFLMIALLTEAEQPLKLFNTPDWQLSSSVAERPREHPPSLLFLRYGCCQWKFINFYLFKFYIIKDKDNHTFFEHRMIFLPLLAKLNKQIIVYLSNLFKIFTFGF